MDALSSGANAGNVIGMRFVIARSDAAVLSSAFVKRSARREIFLLFIATRLILILVTYIGYVLLTAPKYSSTPVDVDALLTSWNHWDAANYVRIAQYGYQTHFDLAFFPLYPFLISCLGRLLGGAFWSYLLVGTLISNGALLGVLFLLYTLAAETMGEHVAQRTTLYLCIFPTAFFFFAAYNESLFLLFVLGTFLALRRQRWLLAGLMGLLAALTRSAGILLVLPYLYELWMLRSQLFEKFSTLLRGIAGLILIPVGTAIYALYCWITVGSPLAFISIQSHSGRHLSPPWTGLVQAVIALVLQAFGSANQAHLILDFGATIGFIVLIILGWRILAQPEHEQEQIIAKRERTSYTIWMAASLLLVLLDPALDKPDILLSNQRFVLELFPAFITLAVLGIRHPRLHQTLILLFPVLQAILSLLFIMNRWIV